VTFGYSSSGIQKPSYRRLQTVGRSVSGALCLKQAETDRSASFDGIRPLDAAGEQRMCGFSEMERCCRKVPADLNHLLSGPDSVPEETQDSCPQHIWGETHMLRLSWGGLEEDQETFPLP
jgi:hypothetical protein